MVVPLICCRVSDDLLADEHNEYLVQREEGDGTEEPNILEPAIPEGIHSLYLSFHHLGTTQHCVHLLL